MIRETYNTEKVYFTPGDIVVIKHDLDHKPKMLVQSVDKATMSSERGGMLLGVTCIWYNTMGEVQKHRYSTKDLEKI